MELTRKQATNIEPGKELLKGPMNTFSSAPEYPPVNFKAVVRPNFDQGGQPLDGTNRYTIHFENGATPPVNAFWSITVYDQDGFQVANPLNRFALSNWMPFKYNPDGSLDLYFQNESPGAEKEANWLPAPKGSFNLTMRLYAPNSDALTGKWNPPPVTRARGLPSLTAQ
jgi:hypothetical protein